jgi:hypothetical protein
MQYSEINKAGIYTATNVTDANDKYVVLISGEHHFLKISVVWDTRTNQENFDKLRGRTFDWSELNIR